MADIYQEIWSSDQEHNGLRPAFSPSGLSENEGYVKLNNDLGSEGRPDIRVIEKVSIPANKASTYNLCRKLFNNYALPERDVEIDTQQERTERHDFVEAILTTPPMQIAREFIEIQTGSTISDERWHNTLIDHWFRRFAQGGDPHLSGFEHVVVGEQEQSKVQGYHFWYKYYLDDGFASLVDDDVEHFPGLVDDRISYTRSKSMDGQESYPESVTIEFGWTAPDYERQAVRPLYKKIGGFFVGCSVEGLMALGTVRAHLGANAPKIAVIEGARYDMKVYRSSNNRHIRTFYPIFKGPADPVTGNDTGAVRPQPRPDSGAQGDIRILAALVNPVGNDPGKETVTLINVGPSSIIIENWALIDKNNKRHIFEELKLMPSVPHVVTLDGQTVQLSNKGGTISLVNSSQQKVHQVTYTRSQAKAENRTVLFI